MYIFFWFFLETFFKLIYLNEAIKHCGRANLDEACAQAHHICYFMIFEEEEQFKMLRCLANCQFVFVNFKSVSDMMRDASTRNKATLCILILLICFFFLIIFFVDP